jgi:hypothetical protein
MPQHRPAHDPAPDKSHSEIHHSSIIIHHLLSLPHALPRAVFADAVKMAVSSSDS